jgi:putative DNA methylase
VDFPRLLIEDWLPIGEVGAESKRERGASSALPALYFLHVWWARRPLSASRAAVLASTLPTWSEAWPEDLLDRFPTEKDYHEWFLHQLGVRGDPVAARARIQAANEAGVKLDKAYDGPRAFTITPDAENFTIQRRLLEVAWGSAEVTVADPMAGGGSIPFEAMRFGYRTLAGELNPVASVILTATLEYPARYGITLAQDIRTWGTVWADRVRERLDRFFPRRPGESIQAYILARTVACPETGKPVPLSPNWWLRTGSDPVAVRLICETDEPTCRFEILRGTAVRDIDPTAGTVSGGDGRSPWTGAPMSSEYIKGEAQAGRMGEQLYAVAVKDEHGRGFRAPTSEDLAAVRAADDELQARWPAWDAADFIPTEDYPEVSADPRPLYYGMARWCDLFSPRQLLSLVTAVEELRNLEAEVRAALHDEDRSTAALTYLGFVIGKATNYNSRICRLASGARFDGEYVRPT